MAKYTILRDTREKEGKGWTFSPSTNCAGTEIRKLDTGDYTIEGAEDLLCIERKGAISEFARNITQKRFDKELLRMQEFKYPFLLLEFGMPDVMLFPEGAMPKYLQVKCRIGGRFILRKIIEYQIQYGVHIIMCDSHGQEIAKGICERVFEREGGSLNASK
jgi:ERCC4-type nuclease